MADTSALIQEPSGANATAEVDAESLGTGPQGKPLRRERLQIAGHLLAQIAEILNSAPAGSEYALVVRSIPSGTQAVSGPLTDTQLRASAVPISAGSLPLPSGASTEATLALIKAKTDNIDVALSTRTKPADVQNVTGPLTDAQLRASAVPVSGTVTASGPLTDAQLRASAVPVTGPLTDAQLRASAVPVSNASLPLPTGAATEATLALEQSTVAKDATLGTLSATPSAYSVLDRLNQIGLKLDATNRALAALQPKPVLIKATPTLLHRN